MCQIYSSPGPVITGNRHTDRGLETYVDLHFQDDRDSLAQSLCRHFHTLKESTMNVSLRSVRLSICVYI